MTPADRLDAELAAFDDLGLVVTDRDMSERLMRLVGVVSDLNKRHDFDTNGRCTRCRPARWWQRKHACTLHDALTTLGFSRSAGEADTR